MLILNLTDQDKSNISYQVFRFPDGEIQISLGEFSHKEDIKVICRITNAEELFLVAQVFDILDRHEVVYDVFIGYLMGMRMDRVMDFNRPFTLKVVTDILKNNKARFISVVEPHSERTNDLLETNLEPLLLGTLPFYKELSNYQVIFPDAGAKDRYQSSALYGENPIFCSKVRDVETGQILGIQVDNPEALSGKPLIIIDDLCDGGGTFLGIAQAIREIKPDADISIKVTHAVNGVGIQNLSKTFNKVYITNSYEDWQKIWEHQPTPFPKNVIQLDVFKDIEYSGMKI